MSLVSADDGGERGTRVATAADVWFGVTSYEVYERLAIGCRWKSSRYEGWVRHVMRPLL